MLGAPDPSSLRVWCRLSGPFEVTFRYANNPLMEGARLAPSEKATAAGDYTVVVQISGLLPGTRYWLEPLIEGDRPKYQGKRAPLVATTAPDGPSRFSVAFGSCARVQEDATQAIWPQVAAAQPDLFLWVGDNVYADTLIPSILAEEYRKQRSVSGLQPVLRSTPQLAIWDDHDFGLNDHDLENPIKASALEVFRRYWANPSYGEPANPGVYFKYGYGGVDFFFLDVRYHRSPYFHPDGANKSLLGARQLAWLKDGLRRSDAAFKVLVSGSGWTSLKGPEGDSWASFLHERDALFDWIRDQKISGALLLSGDTHRGELYAIPWSEKGGYDLYEFVSSPLAQDVSPPLSRDIWEVYVKKPYTGSVNFGRLRFDMTRPDPVLSYELVNVNGELAYRGFTLRASDLVNGVATWKSKASASEIERREVRAANEN